MHRLLIGKADKYLHLEPGTSFQIDMSSPIYFGDRNPSFLPGIKSYKLSVPNDAHNRLILGRPDQLDNPDDFLEEDGWVVKFDGWVLFEGRIEVEDTEKDQDFQITFIGGLAGNLNDLKTTYCNQLDLETVVLGTTDEEVIAHANQVAASPSEYNYLFPTVKVASDAAFETITENEEETTRPTQYEYANRYINGTYVRHYLPLIVNKWNAFIPMLRLRYVLDKILEQEEYSLKGVFDNDTNATELNDLIIFNNNTLDELQTQGTDDLTFEDLKLKGSFDFAEYLPEVKANDLFRNVCNTFAWSPFIDTNAKTVTLRALKDILKAPYQEDWTDKVNPTFIRGRMLENIPFRFTLNSLDEDFSSLRPARISYEDVDYIFNTFDDVIAEVDDASYNGKKIYINSLNEYFELLVSTQNGVVTRRRLRTLGKDFGIINKYQEPTYTPDLTSLLMITSTHKSDGSSFWLPFFPFFYPCYWSQLISPMSDGDIMKDIALLFYRGQRDIPTINADNPETNTYPLATPLNYDWYGNKIGDYSLVWTGTYGLYETWWKEWHEAIQRMRPVTYQTRLKAKDISNIDLSKKVRIDKHLYFIKRIRITLTTEEIKPAIIEYMQIN